MGFFSHICKKAADSGGSIGAALRHARSLINREEPNLTVLSMGTSKVRVRAETLSIVRSTAMLISSICRAEASGAAPRSSPLVIRVVRSARNDI